MLIIVPLIFGAVTGALVGLALKRNKRLLNYILLGISGAFLVRLIVFLVLELNNNSSVGFTMTSIVSSVVGGALLPYIYNFMYQGKPIKIEGEDFKKLVGGYKGGEDDKDSGETEQSSKDEKSDKGKEKSDGESSDSEKSDSSDKDG